MMREFMPQGVHRKATMTDEVIEMYLSPWSTEEGKEALFRNFRRLNPEHTQEIARELKHLAHETSSGSRRPGIGSWRKSRQKSAAT
jgi:hypothetical protein